MSDNVYPNWSIRHYGPAPGSHAHDHFQILWGLNGDLELEIDGHGARVAAGGGVVIAPRERHDFESTGGSRCLVLDSPDIGWSMRERKPQWAGVTDHLARFIAQAIERRLPLDPHQGALLFVQSWAAAQTEAARRARRAIDWAALGQWVRSRLADPLTLGDLASRVCLSESQFRARCVERHACSPMQWLRRQRLEEASLLRARGLSVAEAARLTGYDSPSALTAAMRREWVHKSPCDGDDRVSTCAGRTGETRR